MSQTPSTPAGAEIGLPGLPDVDFLVGLGERWAGHAVAYLDALAGYDEAVLLARSGGPRRAAFARPLCADGVGGSVVVAGTAGRFDRSNPALAGPAGPCPACCWRVAATRQRLGDELAAHAATGVDRDVHARRHLDPDVLVRLCRAVLLDDDDIDHVLHRCEDTPDTTGDTTGDTASDAASDADEGALFATPRWEITNHDGTPITPSPGTLEVLAHLAVHAPIAVYRTECLEGDCEHTRPRGRGGLVGGCVADGSLICRGCSLATGLWAGDHAGTPVLAVPAPCAVLTAARHAYPNAYPDTSAAWGAR